MKRIKARALAPFSPSDWTLIPLHLPTDTSMRHGRTRKDGKRPLDKNWTTKDYNTKDVLARCERDNRNVGVRLKPTQLVIDVDPRNGGEEGFDNLCLELGMDPAIFPRCITGSGGSHFYMTKPSDILIVDTLEGFPGVEFKSKGRQVVAPGSIHPDTGNYYEWDEAAPALADLPKTPPRLLRMVTRPQVSAIKGGGQATQAQIAAALEGLDVTEFASNDTWLRLMMACHHASNGDARSEWIEWSTSDPKYSADAEIIGRRWDSLHREKPDGVISYRTLNKILADKGKANLTIATDAKDDFGAVKSDGSDGVDDEPESENDPLALPRAKKTKKKKRKAAAEDDDDEDGVTPEHKYSEKSLALLDQFNTIYCTVVDGSKFRIVFKQYDPVLNRDYWVRMAPQDFMLLHSNNKIERDKTGMSRNAADSVAVGKAWIEWPNRNHKRAVIFDPSGRERPEDMNLWTGFAYTPSPNGEWTILRELIHEVLANGDDAVDTYILNWLAYMVQFPDKRAEVALVFRGGQGVGKGTLGNVMARLIGRHALAIASGELITGRFNAHLQDCIFLFADEAIKPYDKQGESRLKAFITEPYLAFEGKGRDPVQSLNYLHVIMASNEQWVIPAGLDERRFLVSDANTSWQKKGDKWNALHAQLQANDDSGYKRFLFDLLKWPLPDGWKPRDNIPQTEALIDQKIRSLTPLRQFLFNVLTDGLPPWEVIKGNWAKEPIRVFNEHFSQAFRAWQQMAGINPGGMGRASSRFLWQELRMIFPTVRTDLRDLVPDEVADVQRFPDSRATSMELPSLAQCRADFEVQLKGAINWTGDVNFG